jgi:hypothetical protein
MSAIVQRFPSSTARPERTLSLSKGKSKGVNFQNNGKLDYSSPLRLTSARPHLLARCAVRAAPLVRDELSVT